MRTDVGVWIDRKKAVIVSIAAGDVTTTTLTSDIGAHPHFAGSQEGGGEKKYEERHREALDRYFDDVIAQLGRPDALILFGPGEAKLQLRERLGRSAVSREISVAVEPADKLTEPQIVAKVKEHFSLARPARQR
jgi:stalled ribosome rescue protein Dom34